MQSLFSIASRNMLNYIVFYLRTYIEAELTLFYFQKVYNSNILNLPFLKSWHFYYGKLFLQLKLGARCLCSSAKSKVHFGQVSARVRPLRWRLACKSRACYTQHVYSEDVVPRASYLPVFAASQPPLHLFVRNLKF